MKKINIGAQQQTRAQKEDLVNSKTIHLKLSIQTSKTIKLKGLMVHSQADQYTYLPLCLTKTDKPF